ncbi:MAG: MATE family efflux transporter [Planctomycetota bacterium]
MATPTPPNGLDERSPLREMLTVALPTVVTMSSFTLMQFVDSLMVSRIGPESYYVAAQGNGGMANWVFLSLFFGATSVINTYVSQNLGAGRPERGAGYGWTGIWLALGYWPFMLLGAALMPMVFGLLDHEGELLRYEIAYAQVMLVGSLFKLTNKGVSEFFFGIHRPVVVTLSVIAGNLANVVANYLLIFGRATVVVDESVWGSGVINAVFAPVNAIVEPLDDRLPALGVMGAAYGTVVGYFVECVIMLAVFLGPVYHKLYSTRAAWRFSAKKAKDVVRLGWPAGGQFVNETACWWILTAFLLGAGGAAKALHDGVTDPALIDEARAVNNAAGWIALRYMHAAFMPTVGLSIAVTAIVGRCMGAGRPDLAAARTWLGLRLAIGYMGVCAIAFVLFKEPMMRLFVDDQASAEEAAMLIEVGSGVMIAAAAFQLGDALGIMLIGSLRGAGDTTWPSLVNVILSWVCIVGGGFLAVELLPQLGSIGPWIAAAVFITALGVAMLARFLGGRWRTIRLVEDAGAAGSSGAGAVSGS